MDFSVGRFGLAHQRGDAARQLGPQLLGPQLLGPVVAHRADLGGVGIDLGAIDRHRAQPQQPGSAGQQQDLQECGLDGHLAGLAEGRDRVVVGMQIGGHEPHGDVAIGRALDPRRREEAIGVTVDQQG